MAKQVAGGEATSADIVLWTPWGEERARKQGEKFAALRRLAKRIGALPKPSKPNLRQAQAPGGN